MSNKKIILTAWTLIVFCIGAATAQSIRPVIRFGIISDIQYCDCETSGSRYYRNSLHKLEACVEDLNKAKVGFSVNLGDVTDRNPADLPPVLSVLKKLRKKVYTTPGNHDYNGIDDNQELYRRLNMPAEYYFFRKKHWVFIMLNTNEVASYANVAGTRKERALQQMKDEIKKNGGHNAQEYNGGMSEVQLQWLDSLLQQAQKAGDRVLIFSHHPFSCADGLTALNDREVLSTVEKYSCVKALIAGHHHGGAFCYAGSIPCIVTEGMVETASENAYGIIEIFTDRLILTGKGRTRSHEIQF